MLETIKKPWFNLIVGPLFIVLGLIFIFNSEKGLNLMSIFVSLIFLLAGTLILIEFLRLRKLGISYVILFAAILSLFLGFLFLFNTSIIRNIIVILFALGIIFLGIVYLVQAFYFKQWGIPTWWTALIIAIISLLFGVAILFNTNIGAFTITLITGIYLIFVGIVSFVNFFLK